MCKTVASSVVAALIISAIAVAADSSFSYGVIRPSCAPWDGPAVEIRLTTQPSKCKDAAGPYISMAVWRGLPIKAGQVVKLGSGDGQASRCVREGDCKLAQSGTLVFDRYDGDGAAGHYELQFKDGGTLKGSFEVKQCLERVVCG